MDKKSEQLATRKILRRLAKRLHVLGFSRCKSSFFIRPAPHLIEFVHVHKYTFDADFRVHLGLRVLGDPFEAVALNGPDSHAAVYRKEYDFHFDESADSIERCAEKIFLFCLEVGQTWFENWRSLDRLVEQDHSPLAPEAKKALALAVKGQINNEDVARSQSLLPAG